MILNYKCEFVCEGNNNIINSNHLEWEADIVACRCCRRTSVDKDHRSLGSQLRHICLHRYKSNPTNKSDCVLIGAFSLHQCCCRSSIARSNIACRWRQLLECLSNLTLCKCQLQTAITLVIANTNVSPKRSVRKRRKKKK